MATIITSECINCGACEPECPNQAIYQGGTEWELGGEKHPALSQHYFYIVPDKCTECVGFHDYEACAAVCPVDCCVPDPGLSETEEQLVARARRLHPNLEIAADFPSRFRSDARSVAALRRHETVAPKLAPAQTAIAAEPPPPVPVAAPPPAPPQVAAVEAEPAVAPPDKAAEEAGAAKAPVAGSAALAGGADQGAMPAEPTWVEVTEEKLFARELALDFVQATALLRERRGKPARRCGWLMAWRGEARPTVREGKVGQDGFRNAQFDAKLERERRYGEVYRLREESNGFLLEFEFPRRVPPSAIKEQLGVPDEMPDYDYDLQLQGGSFVVHGKLADEKLRKVAAVSPAFPPDFLTRIKLPAAVTGFRHRLRDKTLEVALVKEA